MLGIVCLVLWLGLLQIVCDRGQRADWFSSPWVVWATRLSGLAMIVLVLHELHFPDEGSLAVARTGLYPKAISTDVSDARLERFFRPEGDRYRVIDEVRDKLVFSVHNLLRDPPFSRQHVISCRNLLIYLDRELQEQAMSVFRYALPRSGVSIPWRFGDGR